jgi:ATP-dependent Lon protease
MEKVIPIFPLKLVVFPNSKYPLHIFEPRYKKMINKCLEDDSGFGIVASFGKKISDVGVYVKISDILKKYQNGELDIIVTGINRFLIKNTTLHQDGYYISEIEKYDDNINEINFSLVEELQNEFEEIIELANYRLEDKFWTRLSESQTKSFNIAEKSGLSFEQQQELLILRNENERINYLINYFEAIKLKLTNAEALKKIIMNDGYLD